MHFSIGLWQAEQSHSSRSRRPLEHTAGTPCTASIRRSCSSHSRRSSTTCTAGCNRQSTGNGTSSRTATSGCRGKAYALFGVQSKRYESFFAGGYGCHHLPHAPHFYTLQPKPIRRRLLLARTLARVKARPAAATKPSFPFRSAPLSCIWEPKQGVSASVTTVY